MTFSRRNFIKLSGTAVIGVLGISQTAFAQKKFSFGNKLPAETLSDPLLYYSAARFKKHIGSEFALTTGSSTTTAVLIAVKETTTPRKISSAESFLLSFQLPATGASQDTYHVFHPYLGSFDLFLVPGEAKKGGALLHAVINRI